MRQYLSEAVPGVQIYLCMESPRLWREVFGFAPEAGELARWLDHQVLSAG
jgi:hypothetical protein